MAGHTQTMRGAALLMVLWLVLLLAGLVAGYALTARVESLQGNGVAVSYTHLDVYKRQGNLGGDGPPVGGVGAGGDLGIGGGGGRGDLVGAHADLRSHQCGGLRPLNFNFVWQPNGLLLGYAISHFADRYYAQASICLLYTSRCV